MFNLITKEAVELPFKLELVGIVTALRLFKDNKAMLDTIRSRRTQLLNQLKEVRSCQS